MGRSYGLPRMLLVVLLLYLPGEVVYSADSRTAAAAPAAGRNPTGEPPGTLVQGDGSRLVLPPEAGPRDDQHTDPARVRPPALNDEKFNKVLKTLRVVTVLNPPYVVPVPGRRKFGGFLIDLLRMLESRLKVRFDVYLAPDGKYGSLINGSWNGMVGEALKRQQGDRRAADLVAGPLTITASRQAVVDFVNPFQNGGLAIVVKKPHVDTAGRGRAGAAIMGILRPLGADVWALIAVSCIVVGCFLSLMNRYNPYEWGGRHELGRASESMAESFNLAGALWFAFTTLQWQGFDRMPRAISSKILSGFWMTFVTVTMATYTASVINHLFWDSTVHGKDLRAPPFRNLRQLVATRSALRYDVGMAAGGATYNYLMHAGRGPEFEALRKYWLTEDGRQSIKGSVAEGIVAASKGKYAFIVENLVAKFWVNHIKPCDLMVIEEIVAPRSYGMALPKSTDPAFKESLDAAILEMVEMGTIETLERKWWEENSACWEHTTEERELSSVSTLFFSTPSRVDVSSFWGPLLLLLLGTLSSVVLLVVEILYYKYKGKYRRANRPTGHQFSIDDSDNTG